jgi:ATP-dependent RNA helicase RhlE
MLDMGFIHDIRRVINLLPRRRQNLMFSATFNTEIKKLANSLLNNPVQIAIAPENPAATSVEQQVYGIAKSSKSALLSELIRTQDWRQVLVFTRTKHGADRLARQLGKARINVSVIHGNKTQSARTKALADFKKGAARILVATDIAARGLDIEQLPRVVNYELPQVAEDYVHRIGRTGRAGHSGEAVSLVSGEESKLLAGIEKLLGRRIDRMSAQGYATEQIEMSQRPSAGRSGKHRPTGKRPPQRNNRAGRRPQARQAAAR